MNPRRPVPEWAERAAAACVAGAMLMAPTPAIAQETEFITSNITAKPPRPRVENDGPFWIHDRVGYGIPFYFQEGKSYSDEDAHVYYAPAFLLVMDPEPASTQSRSIKHSFDEDNQSLTLHFVRAASHEKMEAALRQFMLEEAKENTPRKIKDGTKPYRIASLTVDRVVFRSKKEYLREDGVRKQLFSGDSVGLSHQQGEFPVHFYDVSKSLAEKFIKDLEMGVTVVEYAYYFGGVSYETCFAEFENLFDENIGVLKDKEGGGGEGYVARNQVASIAYEAVNGERYTAQCSDPLNAQQLLNALLAKIGSGKTYEINSWDRLEDFIKFDEESFNADVERSLRTEEDKTVREITEAALAESTTGAKSNQASGGISGGYEDPIFKAGGKAEGSWGKASSDAQSKAVSIFKEAFGKQGVVVDFDGEKFVPKSVDVYIDADLRRRLGKTVTIEISIPIGAEGKEDVTLSKSDRTVEVPKQQFYELLDSIADLRKDFKALDRSMRSAENELRSLFIDQSAIFAKNAEEQLNLLYHIWRAN